MTLSRIFKKLHRVFELCPYGKDALFRVHFYDQVKTIPSTFTDFLVNQENVFMVPDYLEALEESNPLDMEFIYACIEKENKPLAFLYFQVLKVQLGEAEGFLNPRYFENELNEIKKGSSNIFLKGILESPMHILFGGNVFLSGEHFMAFHPEANRVEVMDALAPLIQEVTDQAYESAKIAAVVVKDFYENKQAFIPSLEQAGYKTFFFEPNMVMDMRPGWERFENYLDDLSSKYRVRARNVLKRAEEISMREFNSEEIMQEETTINNLYLQVHKKAAVHFSAVNAKYFYHLKNRLQDQFVFKAFYLKDQMIAFSTLLCKAGICEAHLVGLDYAYNKTYALYPFLLYTYIKAAIERKASMISFGRTASEIKSTIGSKPVPLYCYVKLQKPLSEKMLSSFVHSNSTDDLIMRDPFREEKVEKVKTE